VAMADLNGDGIPDLIEILQDANIVVLLGKGDGTFQTARPLSTGSYGNVLAVGDFNGDGKLDIATTSSASVYILLGHGDGTFGEPTQFQAGNGVVGIVVGDFDGDGRLDIATANSADQTVTLLPGNGDGTFQSPAPFGAGNHPVAIAAADFNGDGKLDIAVTNYSDSTVSVLLGNGNGTLQTQKVFSTNPNNSNAQGLAVGDVNGDGKLDILVLNAAGNTNTSTLAVLTGAGNGTFTTQTPVAFGPQPVSVAAGDVNGDGKLDVVVTYSTTSAGVLLGNGNGTFQTEKDFPTGNGSEFAAIGDLNGDGKQDIATANFTDGNATVLINKVNEQAVLDNAAVTGTGTHTVVAAYAGDTHYAGSTSNKVQLSAAPVAATMTLTAQPAASVGFGTSLSVLVTMTGPGGSPTPTGQVDYTVDGGTQKSATLSSGGTATLSLGSALAVGSHSVSVTYVATPTYLTTTKSISLTVTKTTQTINFTPVSNVTYGVAPFNLSATASSGLTVTYKVDSGPATISGKTVTITGAGSVVLEADQAGNGTYAAASAQQTVTAAKAPLTFTINNTSRSYGAANPAFSGVFTGLLNGNTLTPAYSTTATAASPVGTYPITATLSGTAAGNYTATVVPAKLTVTKATLTVTANNASKVYGAALPSLSYKISGFLNGDTATSATTGAAVLSTTATSKSKAGSYPIAVAAGTLAATNYSFKLVDGTLTVSKAKLTATADSLSMVYGSTPPKLTYSLTGFVNGDTAATATTGAPALTTTAKDTSSVGTYAITIAAGTLEASDYTLALVDGKLTVTAAPLKVVVKNATRAYGAANPAFTGTLTGIKNDDALTVTYSTTATVTSALGSYPITAKVTGTKATNYKVTVTDGTLTVAKAVLTVTATNVTVTYGKALPKLTYTVTGFKNGNTISVVSGAPVETTTAKTGSAPGAYPITITAGTLKATDYSFAFKDGTLTIATLGTVATPTFSPVAGTYASAQTVTIADATKGATIYYALHGAIPTTASTKYTGPIAVSASETIKAIAVLKDYTNSPVASATFTIK
jgi:hypothetical protein